MMKHGMCRQKCLSGCLCEEWYCRFSSKCRDSFFTEAEDMDVVKGSGEAKFPMDH